MNRTWICVFVFVCSVVVCPGAWGADIPIDNPGFETQELADGEYDWLMDNEGWGYVANDGYLGPWNPGLDVLPEVGDNGYGGNAPEGENVGYTEPGVGVPGGFGQVLTEALTAGMTYTLTVEVGNTLGYAWGGYSVQLLAGGSQPPAGDGSGYAGEVTGGILLAEDNNTLVIAEDTFETSTVTYTAGPDDPLLGEPLQIRLLALGGEEVDFDAVSLDAIPEPSTVVLLCMGALGLLLFGRRKRA